MKFNPYLISIAAMFCLSLLFSCTSDLQLPPLPEPIASSSSTGNMWWDYSSSTGDISSSSGIGNSSPSIGGSSPSGGIDSSSPSGGIDGSSSSGGIGGSSSPSVQCSVSGFDGNEFVDPRDCEKRYRYEIASNGRIWMSENLNYSRNGTLGWCYKTGTGKNRLGTAGEDLPGCDSPYGRHYTYAIAMDGTTGQGLCPDGWVIPSVAEWGAVSGVSSSFYVKSGNFHPDVNDPLLSGEWKDRADGGNNFGFYWVRNSPSGNSVGFAFVNGTSIEARSPGASNAAKTSDYFSVRCIMSQDYQPKCGGQPFNPATQKCVGGVLVNICTASDNTSTHYCSNGTLKQYGSVTDDGG